MRTAVRAQAPAVKRAGALTRPKVCTPRHSMRACSASFKRASGHARIRGRRQATGALVALDYPASLARIPHSGHAAPIQTFGLCRLFEMRGDVPLYNTNSCLFPPKLNKFVSWSSKRVLFLPKKVKNHTSEVVPGTWYSISVIVSITVSPFPFFPLPLFFSGSCILDSNDKPEETDDERGTESMTSRRS